MKSIVLLALAAALSVPAESVQTELQPFVARYAVVLKGVNAGTSELELQRQPDGRLLYQSRSKARGLFRMFFSEEITQSSLVEVTRDGVRPLSYRADDGTDSTERDISLDWDWSSARVKGVAEDQPVELELSGNVHDPMSIQLALMQDLLSGRKPEVYRMADKTKIKTYEYRAEGTARIATSLGEFDTLVYSSHRADSTRRTTRMWYAPSLGYIPVQAERLKDGKREWFMSIRSLDRTP